MLRFINKFTFRSCQQTCFCKKKTIRGNHALFVDKELRKAIYTKSRLRNKISQNPVSENISAFKK